MNALAERQSFKDGVQFAWDATSLKTGMECAYKYKLRILEGWDYPTRNPHLFFGGLYAKALENYYKLVAAGSTSEEALLSIVHEALVESWFHLRKPETMERVPGTGAAWVSDNNNKTRETLIRTIIWYVESFKDEEIQVKILSSGRPAVEHSFSVEIDYNNVWCGHLDRLVDFAGDPYVMDQKTTKNTLGPSYFKQFKPDVQMSGYTFAGKIMYQLPIKGVIIDAAQIAVGFSRFERGFTHRSDDELEEWYEDTLYWIELLQGFTRENHFPRNEASCFGCAFRNACSVPRSMRDNYLKAQFIQGQPWDPIVNRD